MPPQIGFERKGSARQGMICAERVPQCSDCAAGQSPCVFALVALQFHLRQQQSCFADISALCGIPRVRFVELERFASVRYGIWISALRGGDATRGEQCVIEIDSKS